MPTMPTKPTKVKEPTMLRHELWSYEDALEYVQALGLKRCGGCCSLSPVVQMGSAPCLPASARTCIFRRGGG